MDCDAGAPGWVPITTADSSSTARLSGASWGQLGIRLPGPQLLSFLHPPKGYGARKSLFICLVAALVLAACNGTAATPTATPAVIEAATPTPAPDGTPLLPDQSPTPVEIATQTVAPTIAPTPTSTPKPPVIPQTPVVMLPLPNVADTVERVRPAVVSVVAEVITPTFFGPRSSFGSGTGILIDSDGLVLTNDHVIQEAVNITVTLEDGTQVEAEVVGSDRLSDLAVLRIPGEGYSFLPLKDDVPLRVGEWVIAIGNALALPGGPTVTVGVISALGRSIEASLGVTLYDMIQTDTVINPGNSGGPLINLQGDLVGINTAVQRVSASGAPVEGIGFAINVVTADQVTRQLLELGRVRWAWMGVILSDLIPEVAAEVGLPVREGVVIQNTVLGGPADRASIVPGDIVLSADGQKVATVPDLTRLLKQEFTAGQEIDIELYREGGKETIKLVLGERPPQ